ncbi:MAG: hypothetical protein A2X36_05270 [Elusimicrobia bacterium GWA2_69_24]|nr:MAG: hypothetical protein A2X36_05270 [Elusimicrobia bacterium GWA2_69_24]HBL15930.1 hypothetical protein [Elusimicrobiota bacterium]
MAILRKREELLPVTCAVLSEADRTSLFNALRKHSGNKLDRVAAFCGVPVSLVSDWASGRSNVPYHFLQRLCEQFKVPVPPVGELRRELQAATDLPSRPVPPLAKHLAPPPLAPRPEPAAPAPAAQAPAAQPEARREQRPPRGERTERQDSGRKPRRGRERRPQRAARQEPTRENRPAQPGSVDPKFSELAAYWTAVNLAAGRVEPDAIILTANDCLGQSYLETWANMGRDLFGFKAELAMGTDGVAREARLPTQDIQKFLERAGLKPGALPPGGAPRWVWSNAQWRTAFVRGLVDASARFERTPTLVIERLPEELRRALKKMLSALALEAKDLPEGGLTLEGPETVQRYFFTVGADNLRLRDQLKAHFGEVAPPGAPEAAAQPQDGAPVAAAPGDSTSLTPGVPGPRPGGRRRGRGRRGRGRRGSPDASGAPQTAAGPGDGNPQSNEPMDDPETKVDIGNEALPVHEPSDDQPPAPPTPFMEE